MLQNDKVILRKWKIEDSECLYRLAKDKSIAFLCGFQPHKNIEYSKEIILTVLNKQYDFAIISKNSKQIVGSISLFKKYQNEDFEIGFWIGTPYQNKGYATVAIQLLIDYAFNVLKKEALICGYIKENIASRNLQEKLGFKYQYTLKNSYRHLVDDYQDICVTVLKND